MKIKVVKTIIEDDKTLNSFSLHQTNNLSIFASFLGHSWARTLPHNHNGIL
jgi:hypothetical protein